MDLSSDHARLEVAILKSETTDLGGAGAEGSDAAGGRTAFVLAADPEVRMYIRSCLGRVPRLRVVHAENWNEASSQLPPSAPQIVIVEASEIEAAATLLQWDLRDQDQQAAPRILILDERPIEGASPPPAIPMVVLTKPFNAEQLLQAVLRMLGSPSGG